MNLYILVGWANNLASDSVSKPLLTIGLAACVFVLFNALRGVATKISRSWKQRKAARRRIGTLAAEVDTARSRHFTKRSHEEGWSGLRKFTISRKEQECDGCHSFYFTPCDNKPLPSFHPGQYLMFNVNVPGEEKPIVRCYSLSDAPGKSYYRCTIKKVPPAKEGLPSGRSSSFFNDHIQVGDVVDVKSPRGKFYLDLENPGPVVLLAGGVGITPVLSMMNTILEQDQPRETHFFLGVRNSRDHLFRQYLEPFRGQRHRNVHVHVCYSRPLPEDDLGRDYDFEGRVTTELLSRVLPSNAYTYFMCGPIPFMDALESGLQDWGVPKEKINLEAFGGPKLPKPKPQTEENGNGAPAGPEIKFASSGKQIAWDPAYESLLDIAEAHGIEVESGCRAGNCGTCALPVKSGTVEYPEPPDMEPEAGMCLPCVCVPTSPVELEA